MEVIVSAVPTGQYLELPYYGGCRYVAYKPSQTDQVNFIISIFLTVSKIISKMLSAYQYAERPQFLIHHINGFHVMDERILIPSNYRISIAS